MGLFANTLRVVVTRGATPSAASCTGRQGIVDWFIERLGRRAQGQPRLAVLERISLAPRQMLALVEADGQRLLVATSPDGATAFYPLAANPSASGRTRSRSKKALAEGVAA